MMNNNKAGLYFGMVIFFVFLTGCTGSHGTLKFNKDLVDAYENRLPLGDYDYFYCGRSHLPYAVIGIDKSYEINESVWLKIDTQEDVYDKIYNLMPAPEENYILTGADIIYHQENKIGIWFSYYRYTVVKISPDGIVVEIANPYDPNRDD